MIIVISVILFFILFLISNERNKKKVTTLSLVIFAIILLATNGQFEYNDYPHYLNLYLGHGYSMYGNLDVKNGYDLEMPYAYFVKLVRLILPRMSYSYIFCYALMWFIPLGLLLKKASNNVSLSLFLICSILGCSQLLFIFTAQRQMIANVCIMWAYYVFQFTNYKKKKKTILISFLLIIALLSHSSSYFVIPLLIAIYFLKLLPKKYLIIIMLLTLFLGPTIQSFFQPLFYGLMVSLGSGDEIERSTSYFINETYDVAQRNINSLLPSTAVGISLLLFYSKEELKKYGTKLVVVAIIGYNLFNSVPLINRALMIFIILGLTLGIPQAINNKKKLKVTFIVVGAMLLYTTVKAYENGGESSRLFPYPYVWEQPSPFIIYNN